MSSLDQLVVRTNFGASDWVIVVVFLVVSTAVGIWAQKYMKNMVHFAVAGRAVKPYLGVATIIASEMGLVTVMYSAQKGFMEGFSIFIVAISAAAMSLLVGLTGFIVVPLRAMKVMTIPEFYERLFSRGVRLVGAAILAASGILNMGQFLKADSLYVTSVMGMTSQRELQIAMTIMLGLVFLYTMLGGMISVLVTDYMQFVIMAISLVVTTVFLMARYPWGETVDSARGILGDRGLNPFAHESLGAPYVLWMVFLGLVGACIWQTSVMRASSAESTRAVKITFTWGAVGFLIRFMVPYFWGICALIYIASRPEWAGYFHPGHKLIPGTGTPVPSDHTLRAMPIALSCIIPRGAIGVLTAGMLAAAMSTYNTYLHTWSTVLTQDVVAPLARGRLSSRGRIWITRGFMFIIAVFLLVWGLWYPLSEDLWDYMAVSGSIYFAGAFAILVAGVYWKRASSAGAYAAFLCGFVGVLGLKPVQRLVGVDWSSEYVGLTTVGLSALAMILGSLIAPDRAKKEDET